MRERVLVAVVAVGCVLALAGCTTGSVTSGASPTATAPPPTPSSSPGTVPGGSASPDDQRPAPSSASASTRPSAASAALARMSLAERVGQLFMVGTPSTGVDEATRTAIRRYYVGSVILNGDSRLGVDRTAAITAALQRLASDGPRLFVATDQEGGSVQRLAGPGFSTLPSALSQGRVAAARLESDTVVWARQLRRAGVNLDLAPVLDTVPSGFGSNPPIGDLDREYGHTPAVVAAHGVAVAKGLAAAGVTATAKHFPGLGRVRANTDTTPGVRDTVTTSRDPYLAPFADAVKAGVGFVMMSTAIYTRIDPDVPAAFSHQIVTGLLRDTLGFRGVIISDDLGAAKQVSGYSLGSRAVRFVAAGGDMVLTVDPSVVPAMAAALIARATSDPAFRKQLDAAALTVLQAKQKTGLLPG